MSAHSDKAKRTLAGMNAPQTGWTMPPIEWKEEEREVPTKVRCPVCHGSGQVADEERRATATDAYERQFAKKRCPNCAPRQNWSGYGTGEVTEMRKRLVLVGYIKWPEGTKFISPWAFTDQCGLCGKRIFSAFSWLPVMGVANDGTKLGMWVGSDCGRKMFSITDEEIGVVGNPGTGKITVYREKKEKRVPKPKPPALDNPTPYVAIKAVMEREFPGQTKHDRYNTTRSTLEYYCNLDLGRQDWTAIEIKVTARHGTTVKDYGTGKVFKKDKERFDAVAVLEDAIPAIRTFFNIPK